jgi:hypothetical protein
MYRNWYIFMCITSAASCQTTQYALICSIQGQTRCTFLGILYSSLFLALHVSCAICTHPQEHKCSVQPCVYGFSMLVHWSRYWLGHPHTFSTVNF